MSEPASDNSPGSAAHESFLASQSACPPIAPEASPTLTQRLTRMAIGMPRLWLAGVLMTMLAAVYYTLFCLQFETDRSDLIDPQAEYHQRWLKYAESFGETNDLVVVVQATSEPEIQQTLDELGEQFEAASDEFSNVLYKIDSSQLEAKGLQYATAAELLKILEELEQNSELLQGDWSSLTLNGILQKMIVGVRSLLNNPAAQQQSPEELEQATQLIASLRHYLSSNGDYESPFPQSEFETLSFAPENTSSYLLNEQKTVGFLKANPIVPENALKGAEQAVAKAREIVTQARLNHPNATIGLTGIPVLENDEMTLSERDMTFASGFSFAAVCLLMLWGFRGLKLPLLAMLMLITGMCWTFAFATLAVGHLNILSISFAAILIGLGIDFGIHYLAYYLEQRQSGVDVYQALECSSKGVGSSIIAAAMTTALAFGCATFTSFLGVAELGLIAGGGILLCGLATFIVLPPLLCCFDRSSSTSAQRVPFRGEWLQHLTARSPWLLILLGLGFSLSLTYYGWDWSEQWPVCRVKYDPNLMNLQPVGLEAVEVQEQLKAHAGNSLLFAVSLAKSAEQARQWKADFEALPAVEKVVELASWLPEKPEEQTQLYLQAIDSQLQFLPQRVPETDAVSPQQFGSLLEVVYQQLEPVARQSDPLQPFVHQLDLFLNQLETLPGQQQGMLLNNYQQQMRTEVWNRLQKLKSVSNPNPISLNDFPTELRTRYLSTRGEWLLQIYPTDDLWQPETLADFVTQVRTVDPEITGTPLQNHEASLEIQESYFDAAQMAFSVILMVLILDFLPKARLSFVLGLALFFTTINLIVYLVMKRPITLTESLSLAAFHMLMMTFLVRPVVAVQSLAALIPPVLGGAMMIGLLSLLQIDLNPANLIVLPLILGIGVDDGVHVVHDFCRSRGRYIPSSSTINAITLTSLTSMIGFGSLMMAAHRGLASLGLVLVIGVGSCLIISLLILPGLLQCLGRIIHRPAILPETSPSAIEEYSTDQFHDQAKPHSH